MPGQGIAGRKLDFPEISARFVIAVEPREREIVVGAEGRIGIDDVGAGVGWIDLVVEDPGSNIHPVVEVTGMLAICK